MFKPVPSKINFPEMEERILALWRERDVFRRSVEERPPDRLFVFYEGPPTANASPGVHHVLSRVFKDVIPRFWTMRGYRVPRKAGWDTHGLPVELEVERELGLKSKPDIERFGVEEFNRRCRENVVRYVREWEALTNRIAFWLDTENPYRTFDNSYIETGWWIIKRLWDGGLIFQDYRSAPHCPRCGTTLSDAEVAQGYQENTPDPSIYVKFRLAAAEGAGRRRAEPALRLGDGVPTYILAWTTTPWTLPGNTALAVAPDEPYVLVEVDGESGKERFVLALSLLQESVPGEKQVLAEFPGSVLVGLTYEPLYEPAQWGVPAMAFRPWQPSIAAPGTAAQEIEVGEREKLMSLVPVDDVTQVERAYTVIAAPFVSMEDGTGVVHIAPAFGADDFEIGKLEGLLYLQPVDLRGQMLARGTAFDGLFVKDADPVVLDDLRQRGLLYRSGTIRHTYPFCWRCDTPLLYYAKPSWYIRTTAVKDLLVSGNAQINWYPEHIKYGRYGDWLANNVDWALSRERYWGTPLPLWRCDDCNNVDCVGSVAELRERAADPAQVDALNDLHRPYVDAVYLRCQACGGTMRRLPEVADAWFDSGAMPYAQWHYPFENQETFQTFFPADFICEAVDQTRGWFYTLHAEAAVLHSVGAVPAGIAFKNVICLGHIQDDQGRKMSKSLGNQVEPWPVIRDHGADALRWYLYTASPPGNPRRFSQELVGEALRRFLLTLWNTYSFFVTYALIDRFQPGQNAPAEPSELDRWVLSELHRLVQRVTHDLEGYHPTEAGRAIQAFVDDLSNWYVRRSRRRFWKSEDDADKRAAYDTLYRCLITLCHLLAPFTPFLTEEMYQNLVQSVDGAAPDSVHLASWPEADPSQVDERLAEDMRLVMRVVSLGRAARSKAGVKIRQPLSTLYVKVRSRLEADALSRLQPLLLDELNVKDVSVVESEEEFLSYQVKPDLAALGPRYGGEVTAIQEALRRVDPASVARAVASGTPVRINGWELTAEDVLVSSVDREGYASAEEAGYVAVVATELTPELVDEGLAREVVHRLQTMRRNAGFDIADRIVTYYRGEEAMRRVVQRFADYVRQETLSLELVEGEAPPGAHVETQTLDGQEVILAVQRRAG